MKGKGILNGLILALIAAAVLFPIYWFVSMSIRPRLEWTVRPPIWVPSNPTLMNYEIVFGLAP